PSSPSSGIPPSSTPTSRPSLATATPSAPPSSPRSSASSSSASSPPAPTSPTSPPSPRGKSKQNADCRVYLIASNTNDSRGSMKRTILCAIGLFAAVTSLHAQTIVGTWQGTLPVAATAQGSNGGSGL